MSLDDNGFNIYYIVDIHNKASAYRYTEKILKELLGFVMINYEEPNMFGIVAAENITAGVRCGISNKAAEIYININGHLPRITWYTLVERIICNPLFSVITFEADTYFNPTDMPINIWTGHIELNCKERCIHGIELQRSAVRAIYKDCKQEPDMWKKQLVADSLCKRLAKQKARKTHMRIVHTNGIALLTKKEYT